MTFPIRILSFDRCELVPPVSPENGPIDELKKWMKNYPKEARQCELAGNEVVLQSKCKGEKIAHSKSQKISSFGLVRTRK